MTICSSVRMLCSVRPCSAAAPVHEDDESLHAQPGLAQRGQRRDLYEARSAIHPTEQLHRPLTFFQGLEDRVVPPNPSEAIVEAARDRGLAVAYLAFEGEQQGFRRAETLQRVMEAEMSFYAHNVDLDPADELPPLEIVNG